MINVIGGPKGSGKTKEIIRRANDALDVCKGNIVYITDTSEYSREINTSIRFINIREYFSPGTAGMLGFLCGVVASNTDVGKIYIDGLSRILGVPAEETEELFMALDELSEAHSVDFVISVTFDKPPKFMKKYIDK